MSFDQLPGISVGWSATELAAGAFLRYEVWRRVTGTTPWTKIARVNNASQLSYSDYSAIDSVLYDYGVTQVEDDSGDEMSSDMPTPAQTSVTLRSLFLHDVFAPGYYVQMRADIGQFTPSQDIQFVQPRNSDDPVAHVGHALSQAQSWRVVHPVTDTSIWDALQVLQERQRDQKSTFLLRGATGLSMYCAIAGLTQDYGQTNPNLFTINLDLQRTKFDPSVA